VAQLLLAHARQMSCLADETTRLEGTWLRFMNVAGLNMLPEAIKVVEQIDRIRRGQLADIYRAVELRNELERPRSQRLHLTVRDDAQAAVVVGPLRRRADETG
jgi:hypothetical protein